jgi:hypothetical protein
MATAIRIDKTIGDNSLLVGIADVTVKHRLSATNPTMKNVAVAALTAQPIRVTIPVPEIIRRNAIA